MSRFCHRNSQKLREKERKSTSASWAGGDCGRRMKNRSGSPEKALKAGKKRKSVSFQEAKDEEDDKYV